ncbi:MAG TPA: hypothetical protein VFB90_07635 [Dehalococcoidia bacterium]|nr:hypothetical protein [Dehalococcoidia bacterium]
MPKAAATVIGDMLDNCARLQPGQQALILAARDGLYGGNNIVDEAAISWIEAAVQQRGADAAVLWIDVLSQPHAWKAPPILLAALAGADVLINQVFDLPWEEVLELRQTCIANRVPMVRNMATTAPLLLSPWARTPYDFVSEIRFRVGELLGEGKPWKLTHPNGTDLRGTLGSPIGGFPTFTEWRRESFYRPFPEGVFPPGATTNSEGTLHFEGTSSWWSRYIGIPSHFSEPIRLTIENNRVVRCEGGPEAQALERFQRYLADRLGDSVYEIMAFHGGVHPLAHVEPHECPDSEYRAFIGHHHAGSLHLHLGDRAPGDESYPYMLHVTAELTGATMQVGDSLIYDRGRLTALDHPSVREAAERFPDRPTGLA